MYPTHLKIGERNYRIRFVKLIRKDPTTVGLFDPNRIEILIKKGQSKDETFKTLLHELAHGIEYEYDLTISHEDIYRVEEALFDFICANSDKLFTK